VRAVNHPKTAEQYRIFLALRERITAGIYTPGIWLPTERELADEFAVNRSVIRGALVRLEEQGLIVRETSKRPWVSHQIERTRPATSHQKQPASYTLAAIMPQHPIYHASSLLLHGINQELRTQESPFHLLVYDTYGETLKANLELERKALQAIEQNDAAGVIIWPMGGKEATQQLRRLQSGAVPFVCVDRYPSDITCDFVGVDNHTAATECVNHLLSLGHQRIGHFTSTEPTTAVLERKAGYDAALRAAGILPRPEWVYMTPDGVTPSARPAIEQFFGLADPPTAVFAMNDALAHYFIGAAEARGLRVPENVSVVGFDDLERYSPRPAMLTTMHQPFDQVGRRAASLLLRRLNAAEAPPAPNTHILLPTTLVIRSTCRSLERREDATGEQ